MHLKYPMEDLAFCLSGDTSETPSFVLKSLRYTDSSICLGLHIPVTNDSSYTFVPCFLNSSTILLIHWVLGEGWEILSFELCGWEWLLEGSRINETSYSGSLFLKYIACAVTESFCLLLPKLNCKSFLSHSLHTPNGL